MIYGVVLIGRPGSGKSTIGKAIAQAIAGKYVSSGDIARELAESDEDVRWHLSNGMMAPERLMRDTLEHRLANILECGNKFVLDGFPRDVDQYKWLMARHPGIIIVHVNTPVNTCVNRLLMRCRDDDILTNIIRRTRYYEENTLPVLDAINRPYVVVPNGDNVDKESRSGDIRRIARMIEC